MDIRLYSPVILRIFEGGMLIKETRVPTTHLMIGHLIAVLNLVLGQDLSRFMEKISVDP
jgi:hypothetical protein